VALLAEDLLGRPLDELPPAPDAAVLAAVLPVEQGMSWAPAQSAASSTSRSEPKRGASDTNVWDQAMPLVNEG
jgi:hypothetical protein